MTTIVEMFGLGASLADQLQKQTDFVAGAELEIESVKSFEKLLQKDNFGISIENDQSLRNNGKEFKIPPSSLTKLVEAFTFIHHNLLLGKDNPFSERTSIHVHVNVRDLSPSQVKEIILCYALLEPLFFQFVGDVRKNSIYCVPLNYTYLPEWYRKDVLAMYTNWHKYTAFNIKPLEQFGTLEFRHLYGTSNKETFVTWVKAIRELMVFVRNTPDFSILKSLANGMKPEQLAINICPTLAHRHSGFALFTLLKDTAMDVKLAGGGFFK